MSTYTSLTDLGATALAHRGEIDQVKSQLGINHGYFDAWVYGFLENKKFDIEETVSKLHRRLAMEVTDIASYELTDYMRASLRKGTIQDIGEDKLGRVVFYVNTKRDFPESKYRDEKRRMFDMFVSYGTRLRKNNMRCQMVMLIDQKDVAMSKNVDLTFQSDMALRISKFYPGGVDKMFVCNMGTMLSAVAKPIFKTLPSIVSDRIEIFKSSDIDGGALLNLMDNEMIPIAFGGLNDCDNEKNWNAYGDRIEKYFADVKRAVNERGLTVKEFELESVGINPAINTDAAAKTGALSQRAESLTMPNDSLLATLKTAAKSRTNSMFRIEELSGATSIKDPMSLRTCLSVDEYMNSSREPGSMLSAVEGEWSWQRITGELERPLAFFFLEELLRWRLDVEDQEMLERYTIMRTYAGEHASGVVGVSKGIDVQDITWYIRIPYPLRALYRLILLAVTMSNALFLVGAFVFYTVFTAGILATIFFGFYVKPSYFFPLNCVLTMVMLQGAALCTRTAEFLVAIYKGNVIPLFEQLGSAIGSTAEVLLFIAVLAVQFIIFCIYAVRDCPLRGLQVSFATGWLSATFIVAVTHVFFFTGLFAPRHQRTRRSELSALPFFLALNFGGSTEEVDTKFMIRTSSFVIGGVPLVISLLFGVAFFISRIVSMYICTIVSALVSAFVINYYSEALSSALSGSLMRVTLWMMIIVWMYITFVFGFDNYSSRWTSSVIVSSVLHGIFTILAVNCLGRPGNSVLLRISFTIVLLYIFACWITCFPVVGYKIGLFCMAIMLHNFINVLFAPRDLMDIHSVFFVGAASLLILIACVLLGWYGTTSQYDVARSLPSVTPPTAATASTLELYHRYPVCSLRMGKDGSLTIADLALLTEVIMARGARVLETDFSSWFGSRGFTYDGIVKDFTADGTTWDMHSFTAPAPAETTVLVLNNRLAHSSIVSTVAWVDSIALSPLSIFLPYDWVSTIVYVMSFVARMIPFEWHDLEHDISAYLQDYKSTVTGDIILTGAGVAGGYASMVGISSKMQTVVFGSPGLLHEQRKLSFTYEDYHRYVLSVGAYYGVLDNIGGQDVSIKQKMWCKGSAAYCRSMEYIGYHLLESCQDEYGRQHVKAH